MWVVISLTSAPSAVVFRSYAPAPRPSIGSAQYIVCVVWSLRPAYCFGVLPRLLGLGVPTLHALPYGVPLGFAPAPARSVRQAHKPPTPTPFYWLGAFTCKPFGVLHSGEKGRWAGVCNFLGLGVPPAPRPRFAPCACVPPFLFGPSTHYALRLKNGDSIFTADYESVCSLPLVAPLRVSLYWYFYCIIDHSALRARCRSLFGRGRCPLPSSKTGVSRASKTPVIN